MPEIWAHRGFSALYPENTMPAFRAAAQAGATGVEFDVQLTADGVPVVLHDARVNRTTDGRGRVDELTWEEVQRLDAGVRHGEAFRGTRVPSLAEVLTFLRDEAPHLLVNVELKSVRHDRVRLIQRTWCMICEMGLRSRTVISSFDHDLLRILRQMAPAAPLAVLVERWSRRAERVAQELRAAAVHIDAGAVTPQWVQDQHARGRKVRAYTVNDVADFRRLAAAGVDGVFTDRVDVMVTA